MKWFTGLFGKKAAPINPVLNMRVYRPDGWNIEFDIPTEWDVVIEGLPEPPNYAVFGIVGKRADGPRPSLILMTQVVEHSGNGLDAYMAGAERQFRQNFRAFHPIKSSCETYQGVPTAVMEYSYHGNSGLIQELNMTAFFGERTRLAFQFICEADKRCVSEARAIQRQVINSIRIGSRGIRVPYLRLEGHSASSCCACGKAISKANALFLGAKPVACYCDQCWQT